MVLSLITHTWLSRWCIGRKQEYHKYYKKVPITIFGSEYQQSAKFFNYLIFRTNYRYQMQKTQYLRQVLVWEVPATSAQSIELHY